MLSIDNIRSLHDEDYDLFLKFIIEVASNTFKILFTSYKFSVNYHCDYYVVKKIEKLRNEVSIDLFVSKIPLSEDDKHAFLDY